MPVSVFDLAPPVTWRPLRDEDLAAVTAIELQIQETPWTIGHFRDSCRAGHYICVGELERRILVYGVLMLGPGEVELLNLAVAPDRQRHGLGRALLRRFFVESRRLGAEQMLLEVRQSNAAALGLYESEGFVRMAVRRNYYASAAAERGREDAWVMRRALSADESVGSGLIGQEPAATESVAPTQVDRRMIEAR